MPIAQSLLSDFLGSEQGQNAMNALAQQGVDDPQGTLDAAIPAASTALDEHAAGEANEAQGLFRKLGGMGAGSVLTGAVTAIMKGESVGGVIEGAVIGYVTSKVADALADRFGMDRARAEQIAMVVTPFIVHFVHEKLSSHPDVKGKAMTGLDAFRED